MNLLQGSLLLWRGVTCGQNNMNIRAAEQESVCIKITNVLLNVFLCLGEPPTTTWLIMKVGMRREPSGAGICPVNTSQHHEEKERTQGETFSENVSMFPSASLILVLSHAEAPAHSSELRMKCFSVIALTAMGEFVVVVYGLSIMHNGSG